MRPTDSASRDAHLPGPGEPWTPISLTRWSGEYLRGKGVENGRLDAELMLAQLLGVRRLDLYLQYDRPIRPEELSSFRELLLRRAGREPLQYVLGTASFRELELKVDRRALIPRPETEVLVGEVLAWSLERGPDLSALDVGTGSGAIALSLLKEGPFRFVVATDPSTGALDLARENAGSTGFLERIEFREGVLYDPVGPGERFHVVVSNPPYVPAGDRESLPREVGDWEPGEALFAGPEGLDVLLPLVEGAPAFLAPGGLLALEVGLGQEERVAEAARATGAFQEVWVRPDLSGRGRVVLAMAIT